MTSTARESRSARRRWLRGRRRSIARARRAAHPPRARRSPRGTSRDRPPRARPRRSGRCRRQTSRACGPARTRSSGSRSRASRSRIRPDPTRGPNSAWENFTGESPRRTLSEIASWSTVNATVRRGSAGIGDLRHAVQDGRTVPRRPGPRSVNRRLPYPVSSMATAERDFYVVLGVERTATDAEIKRAFRKLAQQWHPDVSTDPEAPERFKEINEAYQVLSDPERRQRYDMFGRAGVGGRRPGAGFEGLRRLLRHLRRVLRRRGRGRRRPAWSPAARRGPALRPPHHVRRGRQGHREGDRVPASRSPARRVTGRAPRQGPSRRPVRSATAAARCAASARRCSARWST